MSEKIVSIGGRDTVVTCHRNGDGWEVVSGERLDRIEIVSLDEGEAIVVINGRREVVPFITDGDELHFALQGEIYRADVSSTTGRRTRPRHRDHSMSAPMPGVVLQILVGTGDEVSRGDTVIILEAMKMEHRLTAPEDGTIDGIHCAAGQMVRPGVDLISIRPKDSA